MRLKLSIAALALLALLLFGSLLFNVRFLLSSQASSEAQSSVSSENSYLFASPLQAIANKTDRIRITVFVLNGTGRGVTKQTVDLSIPQGVGITLIQKESDEYGRAIFDIVSDKPGTFTINALVGKKKVGESVTVIFK